MTSPVEESLPESSTGGDRPKHRQPVDLSEVDVVNVSSSAVTYHSGRVVSWVTWFVVVMALLLLQLLPIQVDIVVVFGGIIGGRTEMVPKR